MALIVIAACSPGGEPKPPGKTLQIAVDLPLTGPESRAAVPALNGVRYYVATHPSVAGYSVSLVVADHARNEAANPSLGVANVQSFLENRRILAMIGPLDASVARLEIPTANAGSLGMVSPATSNPCLTRDVYVPAPLNPARTEITCKSAGLPAASELRSGGSINFFRLATTDELQGAAAADYVVDTLHLVRVGVISDGELYGQALASAFMARLGKRGGTAVGHLDTDAEDVSAILGRMKAAGAQAVYYGGGASTGCGVRAQVAGAIGASAPLVGGDGLAQEPGCNSAGVFATVPIADASSRPEATTVIRGFKAAYPRAADFGPYTLLAYDATGIVYAAIERAITSAGGAMPSRASIVAELARTADYQGTSGRIGFDQAGDTTNRVISVLAAPGGDSKMPWTVAGSIDYSARLPY